MGAKDNPQHRVFVKVKVSSDRFVTYHCDKKNVPESFAQWLDEAWIGWRFFNVYEKEGGTQLYSYSKKNGKMYKNG
jgi:hypothetical protein